MTIWIEKKNGNLVIFKNARRMRRARRDILVTTEAGNIEVVVGTIKYVMTSS